MGRYTLAELESAIEGYVDKEDRTLSMLAWHAANILQPHTKKRLTPSDLLPKDHGKRKKNKPRSADDMETRDLKKEFAEITEEFEDD